MREAINFIFNDIASEDMGVHIASTSTGLLDDIFLPTRRIIETKTPYRNTPYYQGLEYEPLSFPVTLFINEWRERDNLRQIARWLMQDYYKPLIFGTNPDRVFYALFEGNSKLMHNGAREGYIDLNVRCNSPFTYSQNRNETFSVRGNDNQFTIYNGGDIKIKPKMWITKRNSGGTVIIENVVSKQIVKLENLGKDEEVFIDFERQDIISSYESTDVYRYDDFNNIWLELIHQEENTLIVTGDCDISIEYQMIYLAN